MSDEATIEVRDLHKRFGQTVALDGLSFTVGPGQVPRLCKANHASVTVGSATMVSSRPQMMSAWTCQQRRLRTHQKQSATRMRATARKMAVSAIWNDQKRLAGW